MEETLNIGNEDSEALTASVKSHSQGEVVGASLWVLSGQHGPDFGAQNRFEKLIKPISTFPWKTKLHIIFPVHFQRIYECLKLVYEPKGLMNFRLGLLTERINNVQPDKGLSPSFLLTSCLSTGKHATFFEPQFPDIRNQHNSSTQS